MVAILLVPQAIAYAYLAGMPPEYGLYTALIPCLLYAMFGSSPHLSIGPVAVSALLVMAGVSQLAEPFSQTYIELVILAGLIIGILQLLMGIFRLGALINLLSYPVITGFTSAASIIVIINQMKDIFGLSIPRYDLLSDTVIHIVDNISSIHIPTLLISLITFTFIILMKRISKKIPYGLIVVAVGIGLSYLLDFDKIGIAIIGTVPSGLPAFSSPNISVDALISLIPTIILVTIIGVIEAVGIAKAIGSKHSFYTIDTNQELRAIGISKIGGSFFNAIPSSGSFSRSALMNESGSRSTVASVITVLFVVLALLFLTPLLFFLPKAILAVIIVIAVKNLFEYKLAKSFFKTNKLDFLDMFITFILTIFISIKIGILIGFIFSVLMVFISGKNRFRSMKRLFLFRESEGISIEENSNCLITTVDGQLNFGNVDYFKNSIKDKIASSHNCKTLKVDLSQTDDIDSTGLKAISDLKEYASEFNIKLDTFGYNPKVHKRLIKCGLLDS